MYDHPKLFGRGTIRVCRRGKSILLVALSRLERFNAFNDDRECSECVLRNELNIVHDVQSLTLLPYSIQFH
jgi:hypothetical protein